MNKLFLLLFTCTLAGIVSTASAQQASALETSSGDPVDQIVAVVNNHIILKSEVDKRVLEEMLDSRRRNQNLDFSEGLWYKVLHDIVNRKVMLEQAELDSVVVSEDQINQTIEDNLNRMIEQAGSEVRLEQEFGKSIVEIRADQREYIREGLTIYQIQQMKQQEINITRPEVQEFYESIPKDSLPVIPELVSLSQIVITPPPLEEARRKAYDLARQLRDSVIHHGKELEEMARKYSDGPSAPYGGKIPMTPLDDFVPEYSAAAAALNPGEVSEVVETPFGFHVIRLNERRGDAIDTNHILINIDKDSYDQQAAIRLLEQYTDSVRQQNRSFAELARTYSEDPNTAPQGEQVLDPESGEKLLVLDQLDRSLHRIVLMLEEGEISEPKEFTISSGNTTRSAWRIVRLDRHIPEHTANMEQDYNRIKNFALQNKQARMLQEWLQKIRKKMYIEYKIAIPEPYRAS